MLEFRVRPHLSIAGKEMVEIWRDGVFVAGLYSHEDGIRVVSKYMGEVSKDPVFPPAVVICLALKEASEPAIREAGQVMCPKCGVELKQAPGGGGSMYDEPSWYCPKCGYTEDVYDALRWAVGGESSV